MPFVRRDASRRVRTAFHRLYFVPYRRILTVDNLISDYSLSQRFYAVSRITAYLRGVLF
jgi:hypothetical protein